MRTYLRTWLLFILTLMMLGLFTGSSCDKGTDPKKEETIIGTWDLVTVIMRDTPVGNMTFGAAQFLGMSGTGAETSTLEFEEDGTVTLFTTYEDGSDDSLAGTWSLEGDELTLEGVGMDGITDWDLDGDALTLTRIMPIDFASNGTLIDIQIDMIYEKE